MPVNADTVQTISVWAATLVSVATLIGSAIASVLAVRRWVIKPVEQRQDDRDKRVAELATSMQTIMGFASRIEGMEVKIGVFWNMVEKTMADMLHRDDTPHIDVLLEKLPSSENLSPQEREELLGYLDQIRNDQSQIAGRRAAAALLQATILGRNKDPYEDWKS